MRLFRSSKWCLRARFAAHALRGIRADYRAVALATDKGSTTALPAVGRDVEGIARQLRDKPFSEYFWKVFAPYYLARRPGATPESLLADSRLDIIGESLRSNPDYYAQTNSDDLILDKSELAWLENTLGPRIAVYDHGGHLGNIGDRRQVADMLDMLAGRWQGAARAP